jgi:hypothetical protein
MRSLRPIGYAGVLLLALVAWKGNGARKEHVRLMVATPSGAPARVRVITRGLIPLTPPSPGRQPWQVIRTLSTPAEVAFGGIGEADIRVVDSGSTLVVDVTQVRANAGPAQRFTGEGFRVSRTTYREPFLITPLAKIGLTGRE